MKITYQSMNYSSDAVVKRYVRSRGVTGGYDWCEVGEDRRCDVRQGTVEAFELPENVRKMADDNYKISQSYVDWPF